MKQNSFCWGAGEGDPVNYSMSYSNIKHATAAAFVVLVKNELRYSRHPIKKTPQSAFPPPNKASLQVAASCFFFCDTAV